jgi:lipoprotein-releasing system ATP-binding protein
VAEAVPVLKLEGVTKRYGVGTPAEVEVLHGIDLTLNKGEFVALIGPSGSGKSTLLNIIGLLDRPCSGRQFIEGVEIGPLKDRELTSLRGRSIGFVFQFHFLLPEFSALDNVLIPIRRLGRLGDAAARKRAMALLGALGLADAAAKLPEQLSGGMRQRVAIARALANDPALILADEPTGNLDTKNAAAVFDIFAKLAAEEGRTVIVVTHDASLAARTTRRIHLVDGRIVSDGPTAHGVSGVPTG